MENLLLETIAERVGSLEEKVSRTETQIAKSAGLLKEVLEFVKLLQSQPRPVAQGMISNSPTPTANNNFQAV